MVSIEKIEASSSVILNFHSLIISPFHSIAAIMQKSAKFLTFFFSNHLDQVCLGDICKHQIKKFRRRQALLHFI